MTRTKVRWWVPLTAVLLGWALISYACVAYHVREPKPWVVKQFQPLPVYYQWYSEVEACLQRKGDFTQARWWVMHDSLSHSAHLLGYWMPPNNILLRISHVGDQVTVKHESIHQILQFGGHFAPFPFGQCDGDPMAVSNYPKLHQTP